MNVGHAHRWISVFALLGLTSCRTPSSPPPPGEWTLPAPPPAHPRLYLTDAKQTELRAAIHTSHAHIWKFIRQETSALRDRPLPAVLEGDFRRIGERIPFAALCYLLTDDPLDRALALRTMTAIAQQPQWGDNVDIEAAHLLYGLAVGYDWLYNELTREQRVLFEDKLVLQGRRMRPRCGQRHPPLNNHRIVNLSALGTAALVLQGKTNEADEWLAHVERTLRETLSHYGSDGLSCEGISYWSYTVESLLKYLAAIPDHEHALLDHPWLASAALAPIYHALPRDSWTDNNLVLNIADSPRFCWYGPQYQLFYLAARYNDPRAQWLADQLVRGDFTREHADWLNLLWYDPSVPLEAPGAAPRTHYFRDWDLAILHGGDTNGTVCSFKCGPAGGGHSQPDANSFTLFSSGAWLAADAGSALTKQTAHHNTILVNGVGQKGEGRRWLRMDQRQPHEEPRFVLARKEPDSDYFVGDASRIYRKQAHLTRFHRHFLYERPHRLTIVDHLAARRKARYDWLLHTPGTIDILDARTVIIRNGRARLTVEVIQPDSPVIRRESVPINNEYPHHDWTRLNRLVITPPAPTRTATFAVVLRMDSAD